MCQELALALALLKLRISTHPWSQYNSNLCKSCAADCLRHYTIVDTSGLKFQSNPVHVYCRFRVAPLNRVKPSISMRYRDTNSNTVYKILVLRQNQSYFRLSHILHFGNLTYLHLLLLAEFWFLCLPCGVHWRAYSDPELCFSCLIVLPVDHLSDFKDNSNKPWPQLTHYYSVIPNIHSTKLDLLIYTHL